MQERLLWFLPTAVRPEDRDSLRRALLVVGGSFVAMGVAAGMAALQAFFGIWQALVACIACAAVCALLPFWIRRTGAWLAAGFALCAAIWLPAFSVIVLTGGAIVPASYYLVFAAGVAVIVIGYRAGAVIAIANAVVLAGVYALSVLGIEFAVPVPAEVAMPIALRGAFIFNLALAGLVAAYELLRAAAANDIEENERRYRALADYGPDIIAELDSSGRVLHSSAKGDSIASALAGRSALDAVHREDHSKLRDAIRLLETQPSVRVGPLRWMKGQHDAAWFEASLTRYRVALESRLLVVARDVSERIALEAQLRQSQKMQAIGQLGSGLAHDFNNLLMVISGYSEVVASRSKGDPELVAAAQEIQHATDQGAALTRRLLGLSRPTAVSRRVLDLNEVVRENEKMMRVLLGEGIALMLELSPGTQTVSADAGELEQVLVNLVANARDALSSSGTVRIATHPHGERVALVVHDNGGGIEAAIRERIFEPFFTTKEEGQGTGLGLYVVYAVVSSLGGEIEVHSDPGDGTRITILFPCADPQRREAAAPHTSRVAGGTERILVVEDRAELRALLRRALEDVGYEVIVAGDGLEALALNVRERIDLVVSDVVMPRMGGIALVAALREKRPELRALFVSGQPADPGRSDARDRVMRKPFLTEDLQRAVREILDAA